MKWLQIAERKEIAKEFVANALKVAPAYVNGIFRWNQFLFIHPICLSWTARCTAFKRDGLICQDKVGYGQWDRAACNIAAASRRVVSPRASPRNMLANSSTRCWSSSNSMVVTVRLPRRTLRMLH